MSKKELIHMKRISSSSGMVFTVRVGVVVFQINREKAEYICRMLAHFLGFEVVEKHKIKRFDCESE